MGRRIYIIGLTSIESAPIAEELTGLLQPPYSKKQFLRLRDRVWSSFAEEDIEYLGDLEMEEILSFGTTNAANVFMEQFHHFFPNLDNANILSDSEGAYWVKKEELLDFLEHLLCLCEVFHQQQYGLSFADELELELDPEKEKELLELYEQEFSKREDDTSVYESKWGADYFNFSLLGAFVLNGLEMAEGYSFFLVFDA